MEFPAWDELENSIFALKDITSKYLLDNKLNSGRIKSHREFWKEVYEKDLIAKPFDILYKNILDDSSGGEEEKVVAALKVFNDFAATGKNYYNNVVVELNKNLSSIDVKEVLSNESLSQHIRDALVNNDSNPRLFDLIKKEVREVKQNELELKLITDTPKLGGILDFPKYSTIIANVLRNSTPQFSIGIFGIWGTGKTTLMKMIQDQLDKDEDKDVVYWNRVSENSEKDKLVSYIKENFNLNWISNINTTLIPPNILVFEHPNAKIRIDEKGTYSCPKDSITFRVNGKLAQIISDDRNINQKLRARSKDGGDLIVYLKDKKILTTWFDAWRYEQEKSLPVIALIRTITLTIDNYLAEGYDENNIWKHIRESLKRSAVAFLQSSKISLGVKDVASIEMDFEKLLESYKGTGAIFDDKDFFYPQASGYLQRAMAKLREHDKEYRIIVFIDDLDRCTPERALEILESIKSFFDIEGIIFVLALNYISLDTIIREKFGNNSSISGFDYIEKIVQLPFPVPNWSDADIKDFVNSIIDNELKDSLFERDFRVNNGLLVGGIERNPRQVKRFMNDVILARSVFKKPIDKLIVIEALKFRPEWNGFMKFIEEDETRLKFLDSYLSNDAYEKDRWKDDLIKCHPSFFETDDDLRRFLDTGAALKLRSINRMHEYQRALESASLAPLSTIKKQLIKWLTPQNISSMLSAFGMAVTQETLARGIKVGKDNTGTPLDAEKLTAKKNTDNNEE